MYMNNWFKLIKPFYSFEFRHLKGFDTIFIKSKRNWVFRLHWLYITSFLAGMGREAQLQGGQPRRLNHTSMQSTQQKGGVQVGEKLLASRSSSWQVWVGIRIRCGGLLLADFVSWDGIWWWRLGLSGYSLQLPE